MWLDSVLATGVTAVTLVILLYSAQLRGWVYFKPQVEEIRKDRDARVAEARADRDARVSRAEADRDARVAAANADRDARVAEARQDRDARLADKDRETSYLWEAVMEANNGRLKAAAQNEKLLEGVEAVVPVVQAIPTPPNSMGE